MLYFFTIIFYYVSNIVKNKLINNLFHNFYTDRNKQLVYYQN